MPNYFIDPSATNDGDGTTAAQASSPGGVGAFNTPNGHVFAGPGAVVWIRRASFLALTTYNWGTATIVGWPVPGDDLYSTRPASGTSAGWDGDAPTWADLRFSGTATPTATVNFNWFAAYRCKFTHTATSNSGTVWAFILGTTTKNCYFKSNVVGNANYAVAMPNGPFTSNVWSTTFEATDESKTYDDTKNALNIPQFFDCTFNKLRVNTSLFTMQNAVVSGGTFSRCTFSSPFGNAVSVVTTATTYVAVLIDCTFDNSSVTSYPGATIASTVSISGRCLIRSATVLGTGLAVNVFGTACPPLHVSKFQQFNPPSTSGLTPIAAGDVSLKIDNAQFVNGNSPDVTVTAGGRVLIQNAFRSPIAGTISVSQAAAGKAFVQDELSAQGSWRSLTTNTGTISKSTTQRTGGEVYSLLASKTDSQPNYEPMEFFGEPGWETIWVPLVTGANTITVYGAYKNYESDPPTSEDVWLETDYLNTGSGPGRAHATTKAQGALTADASTWTGDTVTSFKLVLVVTVTQGQVVPIRVLHSKAHLVMSSGLFGSLYVDPKVVVS